MNKRTTKADSFISRLFPDRLLVASQPSSLQIRTRILRISQIELLGVPRNLIKIVFFGTMFVVVFMFIMLCISYYLLGNTYVLPRVLACIPALLYLVAVAYFIANERFRIAAWMLIALYAALATATLWFWSINTQVGLLALGFVIVLAGTILGARYIIPMTAAVIALLTFMQLAYHLNIASPDISSLAKPSTFADVISYSIIFIIFAIISWLSRSQMEQALKRALAAEAALEKEKSLLATRLEERTRDLRRIQFEEMQQLYHFAELGQLSTVVLHDLANHLTILTLDIDDIEQRHHRSAAVDHAKESISHLEMMVSQVRKQLQQSSEPEEFNVTDAVDEVISSLQQKAQSAQVTVELEKHGRKSDCRLIGDPLRLSQIITILINNAIDAYESIDNTSVDRRVNVSIDPDDNQISVAVTDHGIGLSDRQRKQLFEPFKSTKKKGMGIGLFIAKKIIETHFKGSISLDPSHKMTRFIITVPTYRQRNKRR